MSQVKAILYADSSFRMNHVDTSLLLKNVFKGVMGVHNPSGNSPLIGNISAIQFHAFCGLYQWPGRVYDTDFQASPAIKALHLQHPVQFRPRLITPDQAGFIV